MRMFLPIVLLTFMLLAHACSKPLTPTLLGIDAVEVKAISLEESDVSAAVRFYNPNPFSLAVSRAEADILLDERLCGRSVLDSFLTAPARDTFRVPVNVRVRNSVLVGSGLRFLLKNEVDIHIRGTVRVGRSGIYTSLPIDTKTSYHIK